MAAHASRCHPLLARRRAEEVVRQGSDAFDEAHPPEVRAGPPRRRPRRIRRPGPRDADGALALVLLLDQFPRNLYRGSAHAFATDPLARTTARRRASTAASTGGRPALRGFLYMPFEHSEDLADQDRSVALFEALDAETGDPGR